MSKVAITGASGYIGGTLARYLEQRQYPILYLGRRYKSKNENAHYYSLTETRDFSFLKGVDVLVHCAYDFDQKTYQSKRDVNLEGSLRLFAACRKFGVRKIILISTNAAFEKAQSEYGRLKYELEQASKEFDVTVVRPGLVFSAGGAGIVSALNRVVTKLPFLPMIGLGQYRFYPCHVNDLAKSIVALIETDKRFAQPIIAASEDAISLRQVIKTLSNYHRLKRILIPVPAILVFFGLKLLEVFKINIGFKSDSFKTLIGRNKYVDFTETRALGVHFRPFTIESYHEKQV